jgi:transposase
LPEIHIFTPCFSASPLVSLSFANLVERNGDYYLHVTCYVPKQTRPKNEKVIGINFGVRNQVAFSNGVKLIYSAQVSDRLRRLYHWFSRSRPNSKRRQKLLLKIKREFEKQNNVKRDIINKVAHYGTANYGYVVF